MRIQTVALLSILFTVGSAGADARHLPKKCLLSAGTTIYIAPMANHFDEYLLAGLQTEKVPVVVVRDRSKADYEVRGFSKSEAPGWKRMLLARSDGTTEKAAIRIVNLVTGELVSSYSAYKLNTSLGMQSTGEALARRLKHALVAPTAPNKDKSNSPIRCSAKVYVDPMQDGFDGYLTGAIKEKNVPVTIVGSRDEADFELTGYAELAKATTTQKILLNDRRSMERVWVQMVSLKTDQVVFAYASDRETWARSFGNLAAGVAKHLAEQIKSDS